MFSTLANPPWEWKKISNKRWRMIMGGLGDVFIESVDQGGYIVIYRNATPAENGRLIVVDDFEKAKIAALLWASNQINEDLDHLRQLMPLPTL